MRCASSRQGLLYAVREGGKSVAWCSLSIRCGTRDEGLYPEGIAHFVEHTLFRGTARKSAAVISGYLDRFGGELNAYTTKEEIVLHATVLSSDLWKAVGLLFELATEASFPDREIETERGVILDEIISYKDNPYEDVYDRFEGMLFDAHPLGRPILGTLRSVKRITPQMLRSFVREYFVPGRMALSIVAPFDEKALEDKLLRYVDRLFPSDGSPAAPRPLALLPARPAFNRTIDKRHHEVNAVIGTYAPSLYDEKERIVAALLCNILGGPASNSMLNRIVREKHGWVYSIECSYTQYSDTGIVAISFGCDRPNLDSCLKAIDNLLSALRERPLSELKLRAAKKQTIGQLAISSESGEAQCLSMGKSLLSWGKVPAEGEMRRSIEAVSAEDLQQMAIRLFAPDKLSRLIYL